MRETIAGRAGRTGLYLFALCLWLSSAAAYCALGLMMLSFCLEAPGQRHRLRKEPLFILFVLFLLFFGLQTAWLHATGISQFSFKPAWDWISLWLFIPVAWQFRGEEQGMQRCLVLAVLGLFAGLAHEIFFDLGWRAALDSLRHNRFSILFSQNEAGHYSAVLAFGFLVFGPRLLRRTGAAGSVCLRVLFWLAGLGVSLEILVLSGSRSSWLAWALVSVLLLPCLYTAEFRSRGKVLHRPGKLLLLLAAGLIAILVLSNLPRIKNRVAYTFAFDTRILRELFSSKDREELFQNWDGTMSQGLLIRSALSAYGIRLALERPWTGWGVRLHLPGLVAEKTGRAEFRKLKHLHNGYVILLARFGLPGAALCLLAGAFLFYGIVSARRAGVLSRDSAFFLFGALLITALVSSTNFRWTQMDFRFFWLILAGMAASGRMWQDEPCRRLD